ncbi:MAG: hypothetical protein BWY59_01237 [Verrucomicrobia bacterium ADurb.Bin345]|nr:MAG: hypothetical protein BWY59_01237 [Verrucomicrobia bacterium ADurb.Bin345]
MPVIHHGRCLQHGLNVLDDRAAELGETVPARSEKPLLRVNLPSHAQEHISRPDDRNDDKGPGRTDREHDRGRHRKDQRRNEHPLQMAEEKFDRDLFLHAEVNILPQQIKPRHGDNPGDQRKGRHRDHAESGDRGPYSNSRHRERRRLEPGPIREIENRVRAVAEFLPPSQRRVRIDLGKLLERHPPLFGDREAARAEKSGLVREPVPESLQPRPESELFQDHAVAMSQARRHPLPGSLRGRKARVTLQRVRRNIDRVRAYEVCLTPRADTNRTEPCRAGFNGDLVLQAAGHMVHRHIIHH